MAAALFFFSRWCTVHMGNVPAVDPTGRTSSVRNITKRRPILPALQDGGVPLHPTRRCVGRSIKKRHAWMMGEWR